MKKLILFLIICTTLFACKKHQDPLPNVTNGMATPTAPSDSIDYLRPKRSTFKYVGYFSPMICEYEYYPDGLLRKIIKYDSLVQSGGDSIVFSYTDGSLTKKVSYTNYYKVITIELFTYNLMPFNFLSTLDSYTQIHPNNSSQSRKYKYYYNSNGKVSYVLAVDYLNGNLIDSISIVGNTAITFSGKGEINLQNPNDPALNGYREKSEAHYFVISSGNYTYPKYGVFRDPGLISYDATDLARKHPMYAYGLYELNKIIYSNDNNPFQIQLSIHLMPDGMNDYPEAGFYNRSTNSLFFEDPSNYLIASDEIRYRTYTKDNQNNLLYFDSHYFQRIVGRGSLTPEASRTTLYY